ncbi:MAG: nidogen-like domain-containing protein, partial [Gaiellaceae bacterium]
MFRNDDGSTGLVPLGFTIDFFGQSYSQLYVNNNGNVTFDSALSTFTPFPLTSTNRKIIAPFFGDVDTRNLASAVVTYGQCTFDGRSAFFANWAGVGVGYFNQRVDKLNIFQLILVDRSDLGSGDFDIVFNYDQIQWETGDASGGSGGIGGSPARVGFSNGINTSFEMPGSGTSMAFLDSNMSTGLIWNGLNSGGELGRYRFAVRNGQIPSGHEISGGVFHGSVAPGNGVPGAFVEVCSTTGFCNLTTTSASGGYSVPGLEDGMYNVRAFPPGDLNPGQIGPLTVAGTDLQNQDIVVTGPTPPPPGTSIDDDTPPGQIPSVVVGQIVHLETTGCDGGDATYTVTGEYGGSISGSMIEGPPGTYSADFAIPFTGPAIVTIVIDGCPTIEF